jgi:hypothetical protein
LFYVIGYFVFGAGKGDKGKQVPEFDDIKEIIAQGNIMVKLLL